eukprot:6703674-Prymnesium_polylepis.2
MAPKHFFTFIPLAACEPGRGKIIHHRRLSRVWSGGGGGRGKGAGRHQTRSSPSKQRIHTYTHAGAQARGGIHAARRAVLT